MATVDELTQQIEDAEAAVSEAEERLQEARATLRDLKLEQVRRDYGVSVGSVVRAVRRRNAGEYRVTEIDVSWHPDRPWLKGVKRKKDGTFGTQERHLYSGWELVEPAA